MSCRKPTHLPPCDQSTEIEKPNSKGITCCFKKPNKSKKNNVVLKKTSINSKNADSSTKSSVEFKAKTKNQKYDLQNIFLCSPEIPTLQDLLNYKNTIHFREEKQSNVKIDYDKLQKLSNHVDAKNFFETNQFGESFLSLSNGIYPNVRNPNKKNTKILNIEIPIYTKQKNQFSNRKEDNTKKSDDIKKESKKEIKNEIKEKSVSNNILELINPEKFNKIKGFYDTKQECEKFHKNLKMPITNPKFQKEPHKFDQLYYHAGDWNDMEKYGLTHMRIFKPKESKSLIGTAPLSNIYKNYSFTSIVTTLRYCFYHLKKAIFVVIRNNKIVTFLPFSNANYLNTFAKQLIFSDEDKKNQEKYVPAKGINKKIIEEYKKINNIDTTIEYDRKKWQINNCNIRYFGKGNVEGEHGTNVYKNMIEELCKSFNDIPDCEFIINPRDFPYLRVNKNNKLIEPYDHLYSKEPPIINTKYRNNSYLPILSTCTTSHNADIMIPSTDDWIIASQKVYWDWKKKCYDAPSEIKLIPWNQRKSKVVFRGSATGCGVTTETNIRLKAAEIAFEYKELFDFALIDANKRPKIYKGQNIQIIDDAYLTLKNIKVDKSASLNDEEQFKFKYILYLDGHAAAFRLGRQLKSGSVIIIPQSQFKMWYSKKLIPMKHFVPVKDDLSDLVKQIQWCMKNDDKCKKIGENAQNLHKELFSKTNLLNELKFAVKDIASHRSKNFMDLVKPNSKLTSSKIAIISIFRAIGVDKNERIRQKNHFTHIMPELFKINGIDVQFFIVEQSDDKQKFNIGKLKNIGFDIASKKNFDHYIFTDIDVYPDTTLLEFFVTKPQNDGPMSLGMSGTRYSHISKNSKEIVPFLGACLKFSGEQFKEINGFPNNFWGWGREDHVIANRILAKNMKLYYPESGSLIDLEEKDNSFMTAELKKNHLNKENLLESTAYEKETLMKDENGLSSLQYKILNQNYNKNINHILVDLEFSIDKKNHSDWFPIKDDKIPKPKMASIKMLPVKHQNITINASFQEV